MSSQISLQNINNADWSNQYLDSTGEVKSRTYRYDFFGIGPRIITLLRHIPIFADYFPKPDIFQASTAIKQQIKTLLASGTNPEDALIQGVVAKVNTLVHKISLKQENPTKFVEDAMINVKDLILTPPPVVVVTPVIVQTNPIQTEQNASDQTLLEEGTPDQDGTNLAQPELVEIVVDVPVDTQSVTTVFYPTTPDLPHCIEEDDDVVTPPNTQTVQDSEQVFEDRFDLDEEFVLGEGQFIAHVEEIEEPVSYQIQEVDVPPPTPAKPAQVLSARVASDKKRKERGDDAEKMHAVITTPVQRNTEEASKKASKKHADKKNKLD